MSTSGPRKAVVLESDLPNLSFFKDGTNGYRVRYRLVSEDRNRFSHYSPIYTVRPNYKFERPESRSLTEIAVIRPGNSPYVTVVWPKVSVLNRVTDNLVKIADLYDVWLSWDVDEANAIWVQADRVAGNQQGLVIPKSYTLDTIPSPTIVAVEPTRISVEIYVRADPPSRENSALLVYKLDNEDISPPPSPPAT